MELIVYKERYSELELFLQRLLSDPNETLSKEMNSKSSTALEHFMPYGVFKPTKLAMFGIPADQQLTARQILELYYALSDVDESVKWVYDMLTTTGLGIEYDCFQHR